MNTRDSLKLSVLSVVVAISLFGLLNQVVTATYHEVSTSTFGGVVTDANIVYGGKCALCHGKDGAGLPNWRSKGQPDFTKTEWQKSHSDQQIIDAIKNGKGKFMPAFKEKVSDEETTALVRHIRALAKGK